MKDEVRAITRNSEMRRADVSVLGWEGTAGSQGGDNDVVSRLGRLRGGRTELSVDDSLLGDLDLLNEFGEPLRDALDEGVRLERECLEERVAGPGLADFGTLGDTGLLARENVDDHAGLHGIDIRRD